jgi:hypothetical protein
MLTHPGQELYALGILRDNDEAEGTSVAEESPPAFVIRPGRSRRPRHAVPGKLPVDGSFYIRNSDTIVAASMPLSYQSPIQHRVSTSSINYDIPQQSLPPLVTTTISATASIPELLDTLSSPDAEDWMLVHTVDAEQQQQQHALASSTSPSEPETWILLGDDS